MNGCGVWVTAGATGVNVAGGDGVTVAVFTGAAVVAITAPVVSTVVGDKETGRQADRENRQTMVRRRYRTFLISMSFDFNVIFGKAGTKFFTFRNASIRDSVLKPFDRI
jgi:hypothetical protein